jgi:hypothetical protein
LDGEIRQLAIQGPRLCLLLQLVRGKGIAIAPIPASRSVETWW